MERVTVAIENNTENQKTGNVSRRLKAALWLNTLVILVETAGGLSANSLGLLSDALHNIVDEGTLLLTFYVFIQQSRPASGERTFGFHRMEVVAAWVNSVALILITFGMVLVAFYRMIHPVEVQSSMMWKIALIGSLGNLGVALFLRDSSEKNMNIRSAYLHNLGDALISLSPAIGGVLISATGCVMIDPLIGIGIGAVILLGTVGIFKEANLVLLKRTPAGIDADAVAESIRTTPSVRNVHDLHIWSEGTDLHLLTCDLLVDDMPISQGDRLLKALRKQLFEQFGISHATIQMEMTSCHPQRLYCDLKKRLAHRIELSTQSIEVGGSG